MKKTGFIALTLVTSLSFFGCSKKEEKPPADWSAQTDTENQGVVENYHHHSYVAPFFWYWMATRNGMGRGYYDRNNYRNFSSGARTYGSHSVTGGRSVMSRSTGIVRGGFGRTGSALGVRS